MGKQLFRFIGRQQLKSNWKSINNNNNKQKQQSIYLKKYKVYYTLCPANSYNANLGRTRL